MKTQEAIKVLNAFFFKRAFIAAIGAGAVEVWRGHGGAGLLAMPLVFVLTFLLQHSILIWYFGRSAKSRKAPPIAANQ